MAKGQKKEAGFTLVEMIVVIAILGILASMVMVNTGWVLKRSQVTRIQGDLKLLETAADQYCYALAEGAPVGATISQQQLVDGGYLLRAVPSPVADYNYVVTAEQVGKLPRVVLENRGQIYRQGDFVADSKR